MTKENRAFRGVWIPADIWQNESINIKEKALIIEIDSLDNGPRGCFKSNESLAKFLQCSEASIGRYLKSLEKLGFVRIKYTQTQRGTDRNIFSKFRARQNDEPALVKMFEGGCQNDDLVIQESNTRNIIESSRAQAPTTTTKKEIAISEFKKALSFHGTPERCGMAADKVADFLAYWLEEAEGLPRFQDKNHGGGPHFLSSIARRLKNWAAVDRKINLSRGKGGGFKAPDISQDHGPRDKGAI